MTQEKLENLVRTNALKRERPTQSEIDGLIRAAQAKQRDARKTSLSLESRFELSYSASHSLSLAALRWHGYRSDYRITVFQCLPHTVRLDRTQTRILSDAHNRRNLAAYEGESEVTQESVEALVRVVDELLKLVVALGPCEG